MPDSPARHFCEQCAQSFARKEHLRRHQLKHSATRAYQCPKCAQSFSRSDILRRHELIHVSQENGNDTTIACNGSPRRQRRALVACDRCARFKIRCNGQMPCSQCLQRSLLCTVDRPRPSGNRTYSSATMSDIPSAPIRVPVPSPSHQSRSAHDVTFTDPAVGAPYLETTAKQSNPDTAESTMQANSTHVGNTLPFEHIATEGENAWSGVTSTWRKPYNADVWTSTSGTSTSEVTWDDYSALFGTDNPMIFEYPNFLWPLDELNQSSEVVHAPVEKSLDVAVAPTATTTTTTTSGSTKTLYANHPFIYHFKTGRPIDISIICSFLHPQPCWNQITSLGSFLKVIHPQQWVVSGAIRDGISARVYGMLSRRLEHSYARTIPQSFPPLETIQVCFQAYQRNFAGLYPIIHPSTLSESWWTSKDAENDIGILFTAIMTLGCLGLPIQEPRQFAIELTYLIRIAINESAERDESNLEDKWVLSAWMLMTVFSAWSGVKRHSELAEAFHGVFSTVFLRRNFYSATTVPETPEIVPPSWSSWLERERDRRLAQVHYIVEQEISLFYSIPTTLNFATLRCPMPCTDELFLAESEKQWLTILETWKEENSVSRRLNPPSLSNFYLWFQRHDFSELGYDATPLQIRLLLCTISTQVLQYAQTNRFVPSNDRFASAYIGKSNSVCSMLRLEELEGMLGKWRSLASRVISPDAPSDIQLWCKLMYHIIWLELLICHEDVQIIAGKEGYENGKSLLAHLRWWTQSSLARRAIFHAGRIFKIVRQSSRDLVRPLWWPLAVSRAALVLWCYTMGSMLASNKPASLNGSIPSGGSPVPLYTSDDDDFAPHMPGIHGCEDMASIPDVHGQLVPLCQISPFFDVCIQHLDPGRSLNAPIRDSVHRFLEDVKKSGMPY